MLNKMNADALKTNTSLFLVSVSVFLYQVCLLRIISISDYYHFAFLIISVALLGFGISGSFLYFFIDKIKDQQFIKLIFTFGFSVSIILSFILINLIPFDSFRIAWEIRQVFYLAVYYLSLLLPFFFAGSFIGYIFYIKEKPGITYFYNLTGSASGSILFLILMPAISKVMVIFFATFLAVIATIINITGFIKTSKKYFTVSLLLILVFAVSVPSLYFFTPLVFKERMSPYKSLQTFLRFPESKVAYTKENSYTRIDVIESPNIKSAAGLSLKYEKNLPKQIGVTVDGDNLSPVTEIKKNAGELDFLKYLPISVIFTAAYSPENILVIEPGGGMDVLGVLYFEGKSNIYIVQNNSLIADLLKYGKLETGTGEILNLSDFSGNIYNKENVHIYETSSRNFTKSTDLKFDLILISLSDSYHPISSGAYSLNENYIYTTESFKELIQILKDDGIMAVTRWVQFPPSENLKIASILVDSCRRLEYTEISKKIYAFRSWSTLTTMFKKNGFNSHEIIGLNKKLTELNYDLVYNSQAKPEETNIFNRFDKPYHYEYFKKIIESDEKELDEFYRQYYFNIKPAADNDPYFFNFFKFRQMPDIIRFFGKSTAPFGGGGYLILLAGLIISIIFSVFLIILPLKIKKINISLKRDYKFLIYFLLIGFGFFFIELPFMQKFILILGKPAYSLSIILFSLMLFAGIGSYTSNKFQISLKWVIIVLVLYIVLFLAGFNYVESFIMSQTLWIRFIFTILIIMPLGFFMGMPFPSGIYKAKIKRKEIIPWLWAINGCASVAGSITSVIISIHFGFSVVIGIAALLYIFAFVVYKYS
ncbi:MAG: spermidine synthase family protein [Candidatus Humimicrobiaceae bacterium]